jgi:glutamate-5-semialdehyde dehydrogenase
VDVRNRALKAISDALYAHRAEIFAANGEDMDRSTAEHLAAPLLKRLKFNEDKLSTLRAGIAQLAAMADPLNQTTYAMEMDEGLRLYRQTCPIGVIGIIFESRPDALVQISTLCLKSGNAVLLKGGSEALHSNRALLKVMDEAAQSAGMPAGWAALLETRDDVQDMLKLDDCIDLIIPRGSNEFVRYIMDHSRIPVLGHADGICHVYVDKAADIDQAAAIALDSKTQYVAVCNAAETLLVHQDIAAEFLPKAADVLRGAGVRLLGDERTCTLIGCEPATEADWATEYLDYILSVKIVGDLEEAIRHINHYGSGHTDCIVSRDEEAIARFMALVDSAGVFANCSTRFADGYCYGLGAEVGIGTGRILARGPVGMVGLLIYKYKLIGSGNVLADYAAGRRRFTHKPIEKSFPLQ